MTSHPEWLHYHDAWRYEDACHLPAQYEDGGDVVSLLGAYANIGVLWRFSDMDDADPKELRWAMRAMRKEAL